MPAETFSVLRHLWLDVAGLRIHCLAAGMGGRPVLILHGGGLDAAGLSFRSTIPVLARRQLVFAPDWPGFGESDAMPSGWRVEECVAFLVDLLNSLGLERSSLIGLSMGGGFALGAVLQTPERVKRLVLVNSFGLGKETPGGLMFYLGVHFPFVSELKWGLGTWNRALARRTLRAAVFHRPEIATEVLLDEVHSFGAETRSRFGLSPVAAKRSALAWLSDNYLDRIAELKVPTLIVHGGRIRWCRQLAAERAHSLISNSELEIIDECGHLPPVEQSEIFDRVIERLFASESSLKD